MTGRTTRADRMAQPTARDAVRAVARTTARVCGRCSCAASTRTPARPNRCSSRAAPPWRPSARPAPSVPAACGRPSAGKAGTSRPSPSRPAPAPDDVQAMWVEKRAEAQADRDHAAQAGQDTAELDELLGDLDAELARCGLRGKADPDRPQRRHRSTRRRQDTPDLPRRKISPRTVGKTYTAPDGKTFRPSMFVTLTCPSLRPRRRGRHTGQPQLLRLRAGRAGCAGISRRCSTGSSRTCAATSATTCSTSPPSNPSAASPRTYTSPCAAPSPAPSCGRSSPRPTTRCGGPSTDDSALRRRAAAGLARAVRPLPRPGHRRAAPDLG